MLSILRHSVEVDLIWSLHNKTQTESGVLVEHTVTNSRRKAAPGVRIVHRRKVHVTDVAPVGT